jgi:acetyltransferase-like isoleucine patch superfamily enzyme
MFGDEVVLGWAVTVKSDDGHNVIERNVIKPKNLPVKVGNHVWICSESTVLKGVNIGNDCIVAYGSLVTGSTFGDNLMIAGTPAKKIKENILWKE